MSEDLFPFEPPADNPGLSFDDLRGLFLHFKSLGGHWKQAALVHCGLHFLTQRYGDIEAIAEAVAAASGNRMDKSRTLRKLRPLQVGLFPFRREQTSGRSQADLFRELRDKVLMEGAA